MARVRSAAKARGIQLSHVPDLAGVTRSHFWDVLAGRKSPTVSWLTKVAGALGCEPSVLLAGGDLPTASAGSRIPLVSVSVAAGGFTNSEAVESAVQLTLPERWAPQPGMFAATVRGRSMEPLITDGSVCLFRLLEERDPDGKVVLLQLRDATDPETGGRYTVKKLRLSRDEGRVVQVRLEPLNKAFEALVLEEDPMSQLTPIAELLDVLVPAPA